MSEDSFTEVTTKSWSSRIKDALTGIVIGLIMIIVAFPVLFKNEGRSVYRYKSLKEGGGIVVSIPSDNVDQSNEGKLVHLTGLADTGEILRDPIFGVSANALKIKREVEMFQWAESSSSKTEKKLGGGTETTTTYTYSKRWSSTPISSSSFRKPEGHQNPGYFPYEAAELAAENVTLGAFDLSPSLAKKINNYVLLPIDNETPIPEEIRATAKVQPSGIYIGTSPSSPEIGDTKIRFMITKPTTVSVIAKQTGNTFAPYSTKAKGKLEILQKGSHSSEEMIEKAQAANKMMTWLLRAVGFALMFIGFNMVFKPLSVLADVLPILGTIVGAGTGLIAFLLAGILSLITIAIGWIFYRPLLGIILLAAAIGLAVVIIKKLKAAKKPAEQTQEMSESLEPAGE